jgi:hypothetical protein
MSTYNIVGRKSVISGAAFAQWEPVKITTEGTDAQELTVIKAAANTDKVIGFAIQESTAAGQSIEIALPGSVVLARVGSGGVTQGNDVGLDSSDPTEIAALTLSGSGTTNRQVLGVALRTGSSNELVPVLYAPFITQV